MKRFTLALVLVFCFLCVLPASKPVSAKDNWMSVRSKNFLLVGNASEKQIRQVAARLEQFREVFSRLFPKAVFSTPVPATVIVFKNDSSYKPFKVDATTAGYFQPGQDVNYITLTAEVHGQQDPFSVIFHEYTHLLVNNTLGNVPNWFNEGLAEYYSSLSVTDDQKVVLGKPLGSHVYLLRQRKMLPLKTLFQVDHKSPYYNERDKKSVFYAQSWALVHYLILGKGGERVSQMGKFVELMANNVATEQAFQQAFSTGFETMEKELKQYIQNDRYPIVSGHFERKLGSETDMQVAPISEAEAQAYLGDLLLHTNRADAEGYLRKALALDPNLAMAHASMGMLRVREGKPQEARQSLESAVAANSQNYLIHYYYAYALSREGQDATGVVHRFSTENASKMRAELKRAIELRPDFPESYSLLAFVNLVTGTQLDESVAMLKQALTLARGRNDLLFMLAQVYIGKQDFKSAREVLQRLTGENNADADLRRQAQSLLNQVISMEEQWARFREVRPEASQTGPPTLQSSVSSEGLGKRVKDVDPAFYLREALRKPEPGETQVQGMLMRIECDAKGITFVVKVGGQLLSVKTTSFEDIDITSFSPDAGNQISCGDRKPENNVVLSYVPLTKGKSKLDGTAKSLEFVPKDFILKPVEAEVKQ